MFLILLGVVVAGLDARGHRFMPKCGSGVSHSENWAMAVCKMQGHRQYMEDRFLIAEYLDFDASLYLVLDGHGGDRVADLTKSQFSSFFHDRTGQILASSAEEIKTKITNLFYEWDQKLPELNGEKLFSGSTVTGVLVNSTTIVTINIGDSQTLLLKNGEIVFKTKLHKPNDPAEADRIRAAGGWVGGWYIPRVNGNLAMSRAIGDYSLKISKTFNGKAVGIREQPVIPEPDITIFAIEEVDQIFIASDGIFDGQRTDEILPTLYSAESQVKKLQTILQTSLLQGSTDNMCAMSLLKQN